MRPAASLDNLDYSFFEFGIGGQISEKHGRLDIFAVKVKFVLRKFSDHSFEGMRVLVRVDFNVPLNENFEIQDTTRIDESLPTIRKIISDGGIPVLVSHLGRPKGGYNEKYSLKHVFEYLTESLQSPGIFAADCIDEVAIQAVRECPFGGFVLLENVRFHQGEEKGDPAFALALSELADFFVNDAFGTAHRRHASTSVVAEFFKGRCCFGLLIEKELEALDRVLKNPERPFTAILGGAKISDKLGVVSKLADFADVLLIGGGMAFTFIKARGGKIGKSLCEDNFISECERIIKKSEKEGKNIILPLDVVCHKKFEDCEGNTFPSFNIPDDFMGLDIGIKTLEKYFQFIKSAKTILWNGPMGVFEFPHFRYGTEEVARGVALATAYGAYSVVGGGDSVSALQLLGLKNQVSYVCTGGGAMLEYVEGRELPGIKAIRENA